MICFSLIPSLAAYICPVVERVSWPNKSPRRNEPVTGYLGGDAVTGSEYWHPQYLFYKMECLHNEGVLHHGV